MKRLALVCLFFMGSSLFALEPTHRDIEFAKVGEHDLKLDLYLPDKAAKPPLVVWVHGGAWRRGSKEKMQIPGLVGHGFAIASVGYRLSPVAKFPAQSHDIKSAIRFLRAKESEFGYDAERVFIAGASAGGHLAALIGVTNGHAELKGNVGVSGSSSDIAGIVDFYGPSNFMTILNQSTPHGLSVRVPALELLLGAQPEDSVDLAKLASPVFHVDAEDPPILMIHGDQDPQVPINQSHEIVGAYKAAGIGDKAKLVVIHGGEHGGEDFYDERRMQLVADFLRRCLR